jgi:hypothetical protein
MKQRDCVTDLDLRATQKVEGRLSYARHSVTSANANFIVIIDAALKRRLLFATALKIPDGCAVGVLAAEMHEFP